MTSRPPPERYVSEADVRGHVPVHVVWEITLACNLKCHHCGSRAGKARPDELSTEEALGVVRELAALGTREVTLIGGEAFMRRDWLQIIRAIRDHGMAPTMQSGGYRLNEKRIREAADAGLVGAGVSIDGPRQVHDAIRGVRGSYDDALAALDAIRENGLVASVNTQISKPVIPHLRGLQEVFIAHGARNWQVQLTVAMGRAADNPDLLLQPYDLLEVMPLLAELYHVGEVRGLLLQAGNNVGYYGPYEHLWRGAGDGRAHYSGCMAGQTSIGIEADGTIKGCPSLPTNPYAGGNIREIPLAEIWRAADTPMAFTRERGTEDLWGYCAGCYYAEICRGGCNWTSHSLLGERGNNPYCHHRTLELAAHGLRERVVQVESAPGCSFDHGRFELVLEPMDAVTDTIDVLDLARRANGVAVEGESAPREVRYPAPYAGPKPKLRRRTPPLLVLCRGCSRFVGPDEETCPFCDARLEEAEVTYLERLARARRASNRLAELIGT